MSRKGYGSRLLRTGATFLAFFFVCQFHALTLQAIQAGDQPQRKQIPAALVTAIRQGDNLAIQKLIERDADLNALDEEGNTPLILATFSAGPESVELLLKKGADPNAANKAGVTPLIRAATNLDKARLLIAAGAKVKIKTALGNTPLILAARRAGNSSTVKLLLERGADAKERNAFGVSPILTAAASGDLESVKLLLDHGADVNDYPELKQPPDALASGSRTPLMWATYHNDLPMIRLLLERGADPNKVIVFGTPLSHACWHDSLEAAELLLAKGSKVDARDLFAGFTPLHWAASSEYPRADLVKLLLAKGADPNAEGGLHVGSFVGVPQTPRLLAEKRGQTEIVNVLIAAGAKAPLPVEKLVAPKRILPEKLDDSTFTAATEKALGALQSTASNSREAFLRHVSRQDCASCHQQFLPMAAVGHARDRLVHIDQKAAESQLKVLSSSTHLFFSHEFVVQTVFHPDPAYTFGYEILGLVAEKYPSGSLTDDQVHHLVTVQAADGRWFNNLPRPPIQSGDVGCTALAIQAIQRYGWPGRAKEFAAAVDRAHRYLWTIKAENNEDAVFQLLGLHWAGEPADKLTGLARAILQKQRGDGGWAQLPKLESDPYATGEVLYALAKAVQYSESDPAWQRGLRFLLQTQYEDGTWRIARRAYPFQPTMNSGFPHHRDSWASAAATAWAVMALTQTLPLGKAADRVARAQQEIPRAAKKKIAHKVDFALQIKPLLERSCIACHSGERPAGSLRIHVRDGLLKGGESGIAAVVPGHSEKSQLIEYASDQVPESEMPPKARRNKFPALGKEELALLRAWIDQGADWPKEVQLTPPQIDKRH